ncbi:MAG: YlxM family DNA-binding protein [bacterium]
MLQKTVEINRKFDRYSSLLTEKQRFIFCCYYQRDWSLSEIADNVGCSRQAVHDLLKRVAEKLSRYEEELQLVDNLDENRRLLNELKEKLQSPVDLEEARRLIDKLQNSDLF